MDSQNQKEKIKTKNIQEYQDKNLNEHLIIEPIDDLMTSQYEGPSDS
jgi:hypothetical protein